MRKALEIRVRGIVQGVGFRPFVYAAAAKHCIAGSVRNDTEGVVIHAEGDDSDIDAFVKEISESPPPLALVMSVEARPCNPTGLAAFSIAESRDEGERLAFYSPDVAICDDCRREFFDPADRRHLYPFITCINCGPRFSIVSDIPYDRPNTAMDPFPMCDACLAEYRDPGDRRFHSQPNACPACGPRLSLRDRSGAVLSDDRFAVAPMAMDLLKRGAILAIKSVGGYHLAADAANDEAVAELRRRKRRPFKPFAVMAAALDEASGFLEIGPVERDLLLSKERPIVLLRETRPLLSRLVAPGLTYLGLMLPYTPFQEHLFSIDSKMVLVMTSGNLSDEPIAFRDEEAFERLGGIADFFVTYNRAIIGQGDDSVMFVVKDRPCFVRRSRGFVPAPIAGRPVKEVILAVGGDKKNSFALGRGGFIIPSQYLGDMADPLTYETFRNTLRHFTRIFNAEPSVIAADMHPDYLTRLCAEELCREGKHLVLVQHHHAHVTAVMEEHGLHEPVIGIAFDGTGYGTDGTLWGSEFLVADRRGFRRAAHFAAFPLPGGERAVHEVWRIGISLLHRRFGGEVPIMPRDADTEAIIEMIEKNVGAPLTCSIGRIFDGVSAILGIRRFVSTEAEAAMLLEEAALRGASQNPYIIPFSRKDEGGIVIATDELVGYLVDMLKAGHGIENAAAAFHQAIIHTSAAVCLRIREETELNDVVLSGGVFHNRILLEGMLDRLQRDGFRVRTHLYLPCNDGCIAIGQIAIAREMCI